MFMVTTAERGREVRQRLLTAAAELIAERGWTAVSTRMLAERAAVTPGVVHYHFSSMQALLVESAMTAVRAVAAQMGEVLAGAGSAEQALSTLLGMLDEYTGTDPMSMLFVEAYLAGTRDEQLRQALGAVIAQAREQLAACFAAGGVADPQATAAVVAAAIDGVLLHRALMPVPGAARVSAVLGRLLTTGSEDQR
ncbi:TetR/AcrR family transcriptional regulator [Krasilnikovia sp. M28-CT-15]|uniref:TetR/AcrR family transcriptional regulator n=1 Tax=Krasilnikovia sp. M28-CT-15 TaxID=3373540 RepID=UPI0038778944